jgi:pimeloyl-ACP methyl ester carboxylesterase
VSSAIEHYDEFAYFHENVAEYALDVSSSPQVRRSAVEVAPGRRVSALSWGDSEPELVLIHGGAQNAHTWDTVALSLGRPLLALDLPGHGHSDWRADGRYDPVSLAEDLAQVVADAAPHARLVVGMSLGGLAAMVLAARRPDLVRSLVMVDITPGVNQRKAKAVLDFVDGPQSFASFEELLARTIEHNPTRAESSLRRGILHNAHQLSDGSWQWRYDRRGHARTNDTNPDAAAASTAVPRSTTSTGSDDPSPSPSPLWEEFSAVRAPMMLVQGGASPVVDADDLAEARRRQPEIELVLVEGAGHSIQGDRPVELAQLLAGRLADC